MQTVGDLFDDDPRHWGLRGDEYLWRELTTALDGIALPASEVEFHRLLENAFWNATGHSLALCTQFKVEKFAHGGMSSGWIDGEFWREIGFPTIIERFQRTQEREG